MKPSLSQRTLSEYPEWHDKPLNLTVAEIDDPYLVLREFFNWYDLSSLRASLKQWLEDSLYSEDEHATSHLSLYSEIEKLAEASFMLYQRESECNMADLEDALENESANEDKYLIEHTRRFTKRVRLLDKVKFEPEKTIDEVLKTLDLKSMFKNLNHWEKIVLSSRANTYEQGVDRANLMIFLEALFSLFEALAIISKMHLVKNVMGIKKKLPRGVINDIRRGIEISHLTVDQISDPKSVVLDFFKKFTINYGRVELWDMLDGIIAYEGEEPQRVERLNLLIEFECVAALLEGAWALNKTFEAQND